MRAIDEHQQGSGVYHVGVACHACVMQENAPDRRLDKARLEQVRTAIGRHAGLRLDASDDEKLARIVRRRAVTLGLADERTYPSLILGTSIEAERERNRLTAHLTNNETFFMRDQGQMSLLRNWILPQLVASKRDDRRLRIWSAGSSTGEEAYSLAILLDAVLADRSEWDLRIIGTDIDEDALAKARLGLYGANAFRRTDAGFREAHFDQTPEGWAIRSCYRSMVEFRTGNLVSESWSPQEPDVEGVDLIVCRNVFIYFDAETVDRVMHRFASAVSQGGFIMTGHAELCLPKPDALVARILPESVLYQKAQEVSAPSPPTEDPWWRGLLADPEPVREWRRTARALRPTAKADPPRVPAWLQKELPTPPRDFATRAERAAGEGDHGGAEAILRQAIKAHPFEPRLHYMLGKIAEERGDLEETRSQMRRVLYLDPTWIAPHLDLAWLFERDGLPERAAKSRAVALALALQLPAAHVIDPPGSYTAGELVIHLQSLT